MKILIISLLFLIGCKKEKQVTKIPIEPVEGDSIIFIGSYAGDIFRWTSSDGITWTEETNTFFTDSTKTKP